MAKRNSGEGTIFYDEKRALWLYQVSYTDESNRRKRKKFAAKTKKKAIAKGKEFIKNIDSGVILKDTTLGEWSRNWLENYVKNRIRPRTFEKYKSCFVNYIMPKYKDVPIKKLNSYSLQEHFNSLLQTGRKNGNGLSSSTVRGVRRYLSMCLDGAIKANLLLKNVVKILL